MDKLIGQQVRDRNRSAMLAPKKRPQHNNRFSVVLSKTGTEREQDTSLGDFAAMLDLEESPLEEP